MKPKIQPSSLYLGAALSIVFGFLGALVYDLVDRTSPADNLANAGARPGVTASPSPTSISLADARPAPPVAPGSSSTPSEEPTSTPIADRQSCADIQGTAYRTESERSWFVASCVTPQVALAGARPAATVANASRTLDAKVSIGGTSSIFFNGNIGTRNWARSVFSSVPQYYDLPGDDSRVFSVVFQKTGADGLLEVTLECPNEVRKGSTSAPFGVVTLAC